MAWPFARKPAALRDPNDPESEPDAIETQQQQQSPSLKDTEIVALVNERFELAQQARADLEIEWAMCLAYERGYSHLKYNKATGALEDKRNPDDVEFWRPTNLIRGFGSQAVARLTMMEPGVIIQPQTKRELDQRAAKEQQVVEEHYNSLLDTRGQLQRMIRLSWTVGDSFLLQYWDPRGMAQVPVAWDDQEQPSAYEDRPVGDLVERVIPGWEVYADPRADRWEDCKWVIHAATMPLAEIEERWGQIPQSSSIGITHIFKSLVQAFSSPWTSNQQTASEQKVATVKFHYERPSLRYRKGRTFVVCNDQLYFQGELPCGMIPLLHLGYQEQVGTCYHRGVVTDLIEPQFSYNTLLSRWLAERNNRKYIFFRDVEDGSGADVEERLKAPIEETGNIVTIWHRTAKQGTLAATPTIHDDNLAALSILERQMSDIAGVHTNQMLGAGDKPSGYAIRLLLDADSTQNAPFSARLERFLEERAKRRAKLIARYVKEPRAWGLDSSQNPEESSISVSMLPALTKGGAAVVRVQKGSLTPTTPEAQDAQIMEWAQGGLLGDPLDPDTQELTLSLLTSPAAARALEGVKKKREQAQKRQVIASQLEEKMMPQGTQQMEEGNA